MDAIERLAKCDELRALARDLERQALECRRAALELFRDFTLSDDELAFYISTMTAPTNNPEIAI